MHPGWALAKELKDEQRKEERLARIAEIEDQIFERAAAVVDASLAFHEVTPHQTEPSPEWVRMYGEEGARQRLEVAKAGWLPPAMAPHATKLAVQFMVGSARARGYRGKTDPQTLNVVFNLPAPTSAAHSPPEILATKDIE